MLLHLLFKVRYKLHEKVEFRAYDEHELMATEELKEEFEQCIAESRHDLSLLHKKIELMMDEPMEAVSFTEQYEKCQEVFGRQKNDSPGMTLQE